MLTDPDARDLNANLMEAKRLDASSDNKTSLKAPATLIDLTDKSISCSITVYKIYSLLIWIMIHPAIREWFSTGIDKLKYERWIGLLQAYFDMHVFGLKSDGSMYEEVDDLRWASVGFFVHSMITMYMDR
jgi:hypothetical protein